MFSDTCSVPGGLTKAGEDDFVSICLRVLCLFILAAVCLNILFHLNLLAPGYLFCNLNFRLKLRVTRGHNERAFEFFDQVSRVAFFDFLSY